MAKSTEERIRELADREAIRDLANRYVDCMWRRDLAGVAALFTEDGVMDTGDRPPMVGREAIVRTYEGVTAGPVLQPFVHNHVIDLDGDRATGRCYLDLRSSFGDARLIGAGSYEDEYLRVGEEWKIRSRTLKMSFLVPLAQG